MTTWDMVMDDDMKKKGDRWQGELAMLEKFLDPSQIVKHRTLVACICSVLLAR